MQSILQNKTILTFPDLARATGPLTQMRQMRFFLIYGGLYILAAILILTSNQSTAAAFGHSLILPGSGFLAGWTLEDGFLHSTLIWMGLSWLALAAAGFLWFATGNVLAPPLVWIGIAVLNAVSQSLKPNLGFDLHVTLVSFAAGPLLLAGLFLHRSWSLHRGQKQRAKLNQAITQNAAADATNVISLNSRNKKSEPSELSLSELQHMRLLLDRALQPVDQFEGFEWIDQFQTSAVRYQINFISYALSMAQAQYMPAFTGYLSQAQQNLKAKHAKARTPSRGITSCILALSARSFLSRGKRTLAMLSSSTG